MTKLRTGFLLLFVVALWCPQLTSLTAQSSTVVISEFRTRGPAGGNDEFVELYNLSTTTIDISGWKINGSNASGTTSTRHTVAANVVLAPGCSYLAVNTAANGYSGTTTPNGTYSTGITDDGGVALLMPDNTVVDAVGMSAGSAYKEGSTLTPLTANSDRSYERAPGGDAGHVDSDNNASDFSALTPSAPRNLLSPCVTGSDEPRLSIDNVAVTEGDSGTTTARFTVAISSPDHSGVTFTIATADGTGSEPATLADNDYIARTESVALAAGETAYAFDVAVVGDTTLEADESFVVRVSAVTGAAVTDDEGAGLIRNDDEPPPVVSDVVISQVYGGGGNSGADYRQDFVELFNTGTAVVNLDGWSVQYTSAAGTGTWMVTPLSGSIAPGGYYLVQQAAGMGGTIDLPAADAVGTIGLSGTAGKVALRTTIAAIAGNCPLDQTVDLVGYGTASCFEGLAPAGQTSASTAALRKRGGCFDSDNNNIDVSIAPPTPRNSATPPRSCTPSGAAIHAIQGDADASPLVGQDVVTSGVVTAIKSNGFFLQEPDTSVDGNPRTSEAVFVFTAAAPGVAAGVSVTVQGTVSEFFGLTQIDASLPGDVISAGMTMLPAPVVVTSALFDPEGSPTLLEPYEGMRMSAATLIAVAPTNEFGEIATVLPGVPRPMREPGISILEPVPPDPTSGVPDCCIPRFDENPERVWIDTDGLGAPRLNVTSFVTLSNIVGPLDYSFGAFKIVPEAPPVATANISGMAVPAPHADELTVAGFNIENLAGNAVQLAKAAQAIRVLMQSPDIIGHIEILDQATLQAVADRVNSDSITAGDPDPGYAAYLVPAPLGGTQNVGFLVKTSRVQVSTVVQRLGDETYVTPTGQVDVLHDRPPLVLDAIATIAGSDHRVIVIVNHLRSFIDVESLGADGARVRTKRTAQAESVARLLQELQTVNPGVPIISLGDYNAYEFNDGYTDPIGILKGMPTPDDQLVVDGSPDLVEPNYANLTELLPATERYTFIFEGTPQALDHVLVNTTANALVSRYAIARGNADFPESFAGDMTRLERSSDHDMPVAYLRFADGTAPVISGVPANITVAASSPSGRVVTYTVPTAFDDRDGAVAVSCAPASGSLFTIGTTTVTCSAGDAAGNLAAEHFTVTVTDPRSTGQMLGAGLVSFSGGQIVYVFHAAESGAFSTSSLVATVTHNRRTTLVLGLQTTSVFFSNDPSFEPWPVPGVDTVVFTGTALWNGRPGYTFEARATDQGRSGTRDTFSLTVRDSTGTVVFDNGGRIVGNNATLP